MPDAPDGGDVSLGRKAVEEPQAMTDRIQTIAEILHRYIGIGREEDRAALKAIIEDRDGAAAALTTLSRAPGDGSTREADEAAPASEWSEADVRECAALMYVVWHTPEFVKSDPFDTGAQKSRWLKETHAALDFASTRTAALRQDHARLTEAHSQLKETLAGVRQGWERVQAENVALLCRVSNAETKLTAAVARIDGLEREIEGTYEEAAAQRPFARGKTVEELMARLPNHQAMMDYVVHGGFGGMVTLTQNAREALRDLLTLLRSPAQPPVGVPADLLARLPACCVAPDLSERLAVDELMTWARSLPAQPRALPADVVAKARAIAARLPAQDRCESWVRAADSLVVNMDRRAAFAAAAALVRELAEEGK